MKTVADVCVTLANERHVIRTLEVVWDIPPHTEINRALRRLDDFIHSEQSRVDRRHWDASLNMLIALKQAKLSLGVGLLNLEHRYA